MNKNNEYEDLIIKYSQRMKMNKEMNNVRQTIAVKRDEYED